MKATKKGITVAVSKDDEVSKAYATVRDATILNGGLSKIEAIGVLQMVLQEASADAVQTIYKTAMTH